MMTNITIHDYNPIWPEEFARLRQALAETLGESVASIEHVGSTSVPGLAAKPVIDILIGVESLERADAECIQPIVDLGYEYVQAYEQFMPQRRYFRTRHNAALHLHPAGDRVHIHLWPLDHPEYRRHILFRDYLRAHPAVAAAYGRLKRELAPQFTDGNAYSAAKTDFIRQVDADALAWAEARTRGDS